MTFDDLNINNPLRNALVDLEYMNPTPIQIAAFSPIMSGRDVVGVAQTGTGKTFAYLMPLLRMLKFSTDGNPRIAILVPTRELVVQVTEEVKKLTTYMTVRPVGVYGGTNINTQKQSVAEGVDVLVATPGRFFDLALSGAFKTKFLKKLVIDEVDEMLNLGFRTQLKNILDMLPEKRQNLLFSATFSKDIKKLATEFLYQPAIVEVSPENSTVDKINQKIYRVAKDKKTGLIIKLISEGNWKQVLVFTRTKHGANRLCKKMISAGISAAAIHGNKTQGARTKALAGFKSNSIRVLVATDIAARGLDIPLLPHVINFEIPNISEDYVHRIGRTGRAGASGEALSLVSADETSYLKAIEKLVGIKIPAEVIEGFEPDPNASTEPLKRGQQQGKNNPKHKKKSSNNHSKRTNTKPSNRNNNRR